MKTYSIWKDYQGINYPRLEENKKVDVLIIGGGITGVSCLYHLNKMNLKVMLVEQNKLGMSITGNSTGKLTPLQNDLLANIRKIDENKASLYLKSQLEAIDLVTKIIKKEKIDCDLVKCPSYLYTNKDDEIEKLKDLKFFLRHHQLTINEKEPPLVINKYSIVYEDSYLFHPVKFVYGIVKNLDNIYENTCIKKIIKKNNTYYCYTDNHLIKASWVIIASHYPYFNFPYFFPLKGTLEKSYLSCSKYNIQDFSLISYSNPFISMRTYQNKLIYLSNSHLINHDLCDKKNFEELIEKIHDLGLELDYLWSNSDIMTSDYLPIVGRIEDSLLIGTGYNTWGLANGVLAGKILSDIITNKKNNYEELFNPKRSNIFKTLGNITNSYHSLLGFVKSYLKGGNMVFKKNHLSSICPHMKCHLLYNEVEKTFDCPCHGSRFSMNGDILSSPSNKKIKKY